MTKEQFIIIETTFSNLEMAKNLAKILIDQKLAACIHLQKIESLYSWKGKIANDDEILLIIKSNSRYFDKISQIIKDNHDYELPQIIAKPIIAGDEKYLSWIETKLSS